MENIVNLYDDSNWQDAPEYPKDTRKKILYDSNDVKTVLLKFPEGFYMEPHAHITTEQHIIIKGEYISEGKVYHKGTYRSFKAHENHS